MYLQARFIEVPTSELPAKCTAIRSPKGGQSFQEQGDTGDNSDVAST
jgi:hypothetical protein